LAFWFNSGEGVKLVLEDFAGRAGIDLDVVFLALVLDDNYRKLAEPICFKQHESKYQVCSP
jgi:hypothetical protein